MDNSLLVRELPSCDRNERRGSKVASLHGCLKVGERSPRPGERESGALMDVFEGLALSCEVSTDFIVSKRVDDAVRFD